MRLEFTKLITFVINDDEEILTLPEALELPKEQFEAFVNKFIDKTLPKNFDFKNMKDDIVLSANPKLLIEALEDVDDKLAGKIFIMLAYNGMREISTLFLRERFFENHLPDNFLKDILKNILEDDE